MREVIGKTRYDNEVWIEIDPDELGFLRLLVVEFEAEDEQYDTLCVLETYSLRMQTREVSSRNERVELHLEMIFNWLATRAHLYNGDEARALCHTVSTDRVRYGLSLIHPAYRW